MPKDFLSLLNWKKSIRVKMTVSFIVSILLASFATTFLSDHLTLLPDIVRKIVTLISFLLFILLFFFLFMRNIVRYMKTLADGLMLIAHGELDYRLPLSRKDELGSVAENINYMAEQLQSMMKKERQIERSKMELITNVSHDLRTPLTSIIGYLNLLKNDDYHDLDEHKRYIHNAYNKTQQLKKLIDDLFEYTRLTSGAANLFLHKVDVNGLLEQLLNEFEPIAAEHSLTIRKHTEKQPIPVSLDPEKFVRAIDNLLMNALKFSSRPGEITVRLMQHEKHLYLSVENTGEPITHEQEQLLFERFYKAEPSRHDNHMPSGAGLGLSITRNIIELHGGQMGLKHHSGHFTFYILLPNDTDKQQLSPGR